MVVLCCTSLIGDVVLLHTCTYLWEHVLKYIVTDTLMGYWVHPSKEAGNVSLQ